MSETPESNPEPEKEETGNKPNGIGNVLSWTFGVLLILLGLGSPVPIILLIWVSMGAVLLPPVGDFVKKQWDFSITRKLKTLVLCSGLVLTFLLAALAASVNQGSGGQSDRGWLEQFYADYYGSY